MKNPKTYTVDEATNGFIGGLTDAYATLGQIIDDNTVIVSISGPLLGKAEFDVQHGLYDGLKAEMVSLLRQSRSAEEVVIANPAQGLMPEWGDASEFLDQGFRSFYGHLRNGRQIGGGFPWAEITSLADFKGMVQMLLFSLIIRRDIV